MLRKPADTKLILNGSCCYGNSVVQADQQADGSSSLDGGMEDGKHVCPFCLYQSGMHPIYTPPLNMDIHI